MKISAIYKLPLRITRETKLSIFQFKIIHNILPCRKLLYKMNISESPLCEFCNELESLPHILVKVGVNMNLGEILRGLKKG